MHHHQQSKDFLTSGYIDLGIPESLILSSHHLVIFGDHNLKHK